MRNALTTVLVLSGMFLIGIAAFAGQGEGEAKTASITQYCPAEAKLVAVLNVADLQKSEPFKSILGRETLFDFVTAAVFEKKPELRGEWMKFPLRHSVE